MHWNDSARTLQLGEAQGSYPGMPERVRIRLVVLGEAHGAGAEVSVSIDGEGAYTGKALQIEVRHTEALL